MKSLVNEEGRECFQCGSFKLWDEFYKHKKSKTGHRATCKECMRPKVRTQNKQFRAALKLEVLEAYGGQCYCCGETFWKFLTIDHMNDDGAEHKRLNNIRTSTQFYSWLKKNNYPDEYQCMCWNCNSARYFNGGICPHKELIIKIAREAARTAAPGEMMNVRVLSGVVICSSEN